MASSKLVGGVEEQKRSWLVIEPGGLGGVGRRWLVIVLILLSISAVCGQWVPYYTVLY